VVLAQGAMRAVRGGALPYQCLSLGIHWVRLLRRPGELAARERGKRPRMRAVPQERGINILFSNIFGAWLMGLRCISHCELPASVAPLSCLVYRTRRGTRNSRHNKVYLDAHEYNSGREGGGCQGLGGYQLSDFWRCWPSSQTLIL
jgi:hypothetical protein